KWPSSPNADDDILVIPDGGREREVEAKDALSQVMAGSAFYKLLPTIYTGGFVRMSAVTHIKNESGAFFNSQIPDLYSSMALCATIKKYIYSYNVVSIEGVSKSSTGTSLLANRFQEASAIQAFSAESTIPLH